MTTHTDHELQLTTHLHTHNACTYKSKNLRQTATNFFERTVYFQCSSIDL